LKSSKESCDTLLIRSNVSWELGYSDYWFDVNQSYGDSSAKILVCSTAANPGQNSRMQPLYVTGYNTIPVIQDGLSFGVENINDVTISISPNPVSTFADISISGLPSMNRIYLTLIDLTGRTVYKSNFTTLDFRIERGQIPSGMYLLQIKIGDEKLLQTKIIFE